MLYRSQVVKIEGNSNKVLGIGIVHHLLCQKLPLFKTKLSLWLQDHPFSSEAEILYWWTRQTHPNFLSNFRFLNFIPVLFSLKMLSVKNMHACYVLNEYINKYYRLFPQKRYQNTVPLRLASNQVLYIYLWFRF